MVRTYDMSSIRYMRPVLTHEVIVSTEELEVPPHMLMNRHLPRRSLSVRTANRSNFPTIWTQTMTMKLARMKFWPRLRPLMTLYSIQTGQKTRPERCALPGSNRSTDCYEGASGSK